MIDTKHLRAVVERGLGPVYDDYGHVVFDQRLLARVAKALLPVLEAAEAGPCRHDSSHRGDACALCDAIKAAREVIRP